MALAVAPAGAVDPLTPPPEWAAELACQRLTLVYRNAATTYIVALLVALALLTATWGSVPAAWAAGWFAYMSALTAMRLYHVHAYQRRPDSATLESWERRFLLGVLASGVGWGTAAFVVVPLMSPEYRAMVAISLSGITAATTAAYAYFRTALRSFLALVLLPLAVAYLLLGGAENVILAFLIGCYTLLMLGLAERTNRSVGEALSLRMSNTRLIEHLSTQKEQVERLNRELQREVTKQRRVEEELRAASQRAEQAARSKAEFLANMSHEIRTPLNGVLGMTEMLADTNLTPRQTRLVDTIQQSGEALLGIINDVLDFSRIDAGKLEIHSRPFDLQGLVEDVADLFAESASRAGITLNSALPADLHPVYVGDPDRVRQVLTNLVSNAVKFTPGGEITIAAAVLEECDAQARLRLEVRDTGIGIREEHLERIFDSFTQADGSTTRQFGGTGLGLAICRQLVSLMGGQIGVESRVGRGSIFWFTLILPKEGLEAVGQRKFDNRALQGRRVLVASDNQVLRQILGEQIRAWGGQSVEVADGHAVTAAFDADGAEEVSLDAALLDDGLSGPRPLELVRRIRESSANQDPRIIILSSADNLSDTGQWLAKGVDRYVTKPIRKRQLYDCLLTQIGRRSGRQRQARSPAMRSDAGLRFDAHVLVVEDNPVNSELARALLEGMGCRVTVVENGREAVEAMAESPLDRRSDPYALVLMDCQMPIMDGYQASARIREWESGRRQERTPIVALTANALEGDRSKCIAAGMDDYLAKPFKRQQLAELLERWLPLSSRRPPDTAAAPAPSAGRAAAAAALDVAALDGIRELQRPGEPNLLARIIDLYLDNAPKLLAEMQDGLACGNAQRLRQAAHTLKSSSANIGAASLAARCAELEAAAHRGSLDGAGAQLDVMDFELQGVIAALERERPSGAGKGAA